MASGGGEEGGGKSGFVVGEDSSKGIDEGGRLPQQLLGLLHCHVTDAGDLDSYC